MAKIFISYSSRDRELVQEYVSLLRKYDHDILMDDTVLKPGEDMETSLLKAITEADGTVVFITANSIQSTNVMSEIGIARSHIDSKFLIPLIKGEIKLPYVIQSLTYIQIDARVPAEIVKIINDEIVLHENSKIKSSRDVPRDVKNSPPDFKTATRLNIGDTGDFPRVDMDPEELKSIQTFLKEEGFFDSFIDGIPGPVTTEAIKKFQRKYELPESGIWDLTTQKIREALLKARSIINEKIASGPKYWILKLKTPTWGIGTLKRGTVCWFNSYKEKQKRPEYDLFQKVKHGDMILGYAQGIINGITGSFKVTEGIHNDDQQGEIISFEAEEILQTPFLLPEKVLSFQDELTGDNELRLFEIDKSIFEKILLQTIVPGDPPGRIHTTLPFFYTEGNHSNDDKLDFENDYKSLAAVMSMANVKPPLAIGLFGKWGSGKSFFMEKLYEQVNDYAETKKPEFVENVVQVKFNSWHYADTNLWACMVTEIFDSLNRYSTNKKNLDELQRLKNTLAFTTMQKEAAELRKSQLEARVSDVEQEKQEKHDRLEDITGWDLLKLVISDKKVSSDRQPLKNKEVEEILANANDIKASMEELRSFGSKVLGSWQMLKKMKGWKWIYGLAIAIIIGVMSLLLTSVFKNEYQQSLAKIAAFTTTAATVTGYIMQFFRPVKRKFDEGYERLKSLQDTIENRPGEISPELIASSNELIGLKNSIASLNETQQTTQREIQEIVEGKRLFDFIEQRTSDQHYSQQLGLMSWIRRDFNRLDELLRLQYQHQDPKSKEVYNPEKVKLQIDRIILYIDDLDRCNEDIVIKVLEAIHLLLAFPLFVVVVGVDPRWLNNAINKKFEALFGVSRPENGTEHTPAGGLPETVLAGAATSYDYLEKIFQIPFCLKPVTKTGREKLITYLLQEEMEKKKQDDKKNEKQGSPEKKNDQDKTVAERSNQGINAEASTTTVSLNSEQVSTNTSPDPKMDTDSQASKTEQAQKENGKKKKQIEEITQKLTFTDDELEFMKKISPVFGSSPRTINRFINIYRIIKSHKSLKVSKEFSRDDYGPVLILLSIVVGFSTIAQPFIEKLSNAKGDKSFKSFLETKDIDSEIKKALLTYADADLLQFNNQIYQDNIGLISRFSFRTLID